jgi:dethiobiotin synthetase
MASGYFITGTDTECGKTEITLGLMHLFKAKGKSVLGMKPVASGAIQTEDGLRNEDALRIQQYASAPIPYDLVNPYAFEPPIAPHLASDMAEQEINFELILECYERLATMSDLVLVEGVGGWRVPLSKDGDVSDMALALNLPVILVVGMKLGCLNHALLSVESIQQKGLSLAGWVANIMGPEMDELDANLETLKHQIDAPCLGLVPNMRTVDTGAVADCLKL